MLLNSSKLRSCILTNLLKVQIHKMNNSKKKFMSNPLKHFSMIHTHQNFKLNLKDHPVRKMKNKMNNSKATNNDQFRNRNGKRIRSLTSKKRNSEKKVLEKFLILNFHQIKKIKEFNLKKDKHLMTRQNL